MVWVCSSSPIKLKSSIYIHSHTHLLRSAFDIVSSRWRCNLSFLSCFSFSWSSDRIFWNIFLTGVFKGLMNIFQPFTQNICNVSKAGIHVLNVQELTDRMIRTKCACWYSTAHVSRMMQRFLRHLCIPRPLPWPRVPHVERLYACGQVFKHMWKTITRWWRYSAWPRQCRHPLMLFWYWGYRWIMIKLSHRGHKISQRFQR